MTHKTYSECLQEQEQWKHDHPIRSTLRDALLTVRYVPLRVLGETWDEVKYGFQRMFRGYDDRMVWGHYTENARMTLAALKRLKQGKLGAPGTFDPDGVLVASGYFERWDEALQLMIDGFQAMLDKDDVFICNESGHYDLKANRAEQKRLHAIWKKGARLYIANYEGLWD